MQHYARRINEVRSLSICLKKITVIRNALWTLILTRFLVNDEELPTKSDTWRRILLSGDGPYVFGYTAHLYRKSAIHKLDNLYVYNQLLPTVSVAFNVRTCRNISYYLFTLTL